MGLALLGWLLTSVPLTALAPLALLPVPLLVARRQGRRLDPLEPVWAVSLLFAFEYLLVPSLSALRPAEFMSLPGYLDLPPFQWQAATWLSGAAFLGFVAGYFSRAWGAGLPRQPPPRAVGLPGPAGPRTLLVGAGLWLAGIAAVAEGIRINEGQQLEVFDLLTGGLRQSTLSSFSGRGYLAIGFLALALSIPCLVLWALDNPRARVRWWLTGTAGVLALVALGGIVGSRILALGIPAGVVVIVHYRVRFLSVRAIGAGGLLLVAIGIAILSLRSDRPVGDPISAAALLALTLDGFNFLVNATARVHDFMLGASVVEDVVVTNVPRVLWEGKPTIYGALSVQEAIVPGLYAAVGGTSTYPAGIVAEGYVNLGVLGALGFPFVAGLLLRRIYERLRAAPDAFHLLLMAWLVPNTVALLRSLGPFVAQLLVVALLLSPLLWRRRGRSAEPVSGGSAAGSRLESSAAG